MVVFVLGGLDHENVSATAVVDPLPPHEYSCGGRFLPVQSPSSEARVGALSRSGDRVLRRRLVWSRERALSVSY